MIPDSRYIRVGWADLRNGDTVSLIGYFRGKEYVCGEYKVIDAAKELLRNGRSRYSFTIGSPCDPDVLLVKRKINPHFQKSRLGSEYQPPRLFPKSPAPPPLSILVTDPNIPPA